MDEPFAALDAYTREDLQNLCVDLHKENDLITVLVTHNIEEAVALGQKILVFADQPKFQVKIFDNPHDWDSTFRQQKEYFELCSQLRATIQIQGEGKK